MTTKTIERPCPVQRKDIRDMGIISYGAAYVLLILLFSRLYHLTPVYNAAVSLWLKLIFYCMLGAGGIFLFRDMLKDGLTRWREHPVKNILWIVGALICEILLDNLAAIPPALLYPDYTGMNDSNLSELSKYVPAAFIVISLGILGPVTEECIFRFILIDKAKRRMPAAVCIMVSSLFFMAIHMHAFTLPELMYCLPHFMTGLLFAVCLLKTKDPTIPVILHILNNSSAFLLTGAAK